MVNSANLEAVLVAPQQPALPPFVARCAAAHDTGLCEDTRSTVGVGPLLARDCRESDGVLVILAEVEVAREPGLDAAVLADELDVLLGDVTRRVVEPAAPVDHVVLLKHTESGTHRRSVGEDDNPPALSSRVRLDELLEPRDLGIINGHLVRGVLGVTKDSGAEADQKSLLSDLAAELRGLLVVALQVDCQVLLVRRELVDALKVVVAADYLVRDSERAKVFRGQLMALSGACEQLGLWLACTPV
mmetsp:Transcript_24257/g.55801  ORF Transcript_24257/g.55801 Transcript_24257/m.55801 type:complete len:245 (-) Transcript_24257:525-1259(-)